MPERFFITYNASAFPTMGLSDDYFVRQRDMLLQNSRPVQELNILKMQYESKSMEEYRKQKAFSLKITQLMVVGWKVGMNMLASSLFSKTVLLRQAHCRQAYYKPFDSLRSLRASGSALLTIDNLPSPNLRTGQASSIYSESHRRTTPAR